MKTMQEKAQTAFNKRWERHIDGMSPVILDMETKGRWLPENWYRDGYLAGYDARDKELMEISGQGFEEWFQDKFHAIQFESEEMYYSCKFENSETWQASRLSMMAENEELKKQIQDQMLLLAENMQLKKDLEKVIREAGYELHPDDEKEIRKRHNLGESE